MPRPNLGLLRATGKAWKTRRRDHFLFSSPLNNNQIVYSLLFAHPFVESGQDIPEQFLHYQHRHTAGGSSPRYVTHVEVNNALFVHATPHSEEPNYDCRPG